MTNDHPAAAAFLANVVAGVAPDKCMREVRICWRVEPLTVHRGPWRPIKRHIELAHWCQAQNTLHGARTHWLEFRDA